MATKRITNVQFIATYIFQHSMEARQSDIRKALWRWKNGVDIDQEVPYKVRGWFKENCTDSHKWKTSFSRGWMVRYFIHSHWASNYDCIEKYWPRTKRGHYTLNTGGLLKVLHHKELDTTKFDW